LLPLSFPNPFLHLSKHSRQILKTPARDRFGAFIKIKDFHGNKSGIPNLFQSGGNRFEIHIAKSRPFQVFVVGVKMAEMRR